MQVFKQGFQRLFPVVLVFFTLALCAQAVTVEVGSCISGLVQFTSITDAISHSPAGTTIDVCPGPYYEQITINKQLTIRGVSVNGQNAAIILPPQSGMAANAKDFDNNDSPIAAQVVVQGATKVNLSDLIVDGSNNQINGCAPDLQGVLFQNASGTLNHVTVRNQYLAPNLNGCQSGEGIFVQTSSGKVSNLQVLASSVHGYQKNGITGNDAGTTLTVNNSRVQGFGVVQPPAAAQNGIQIAFGADGTVIGNTVMDDVYGDPNTAIATGILLYDAAETANIKVNGNTVGNTQGAVVIYTDTPGTGDGVTARSNNIFATVSYDAIDVCTNSNDIEYNTIYDSALSAVHLDASYSEGSDNTVANNKITDSGCAGILVDTGSSNDTINTNTFFDVPYTTPNGSCPPQGASKHNGVHGKAHLNPKGKK